VDLMLAAMEGVKLRAGFEPHIGEPSEQRTIVDGLMTILVGAGPRSIPGGMDGGGRAGRTGGGRRRRAA
jgi:hypothetical protein